MKNIINALNSENHSRIAKGLKKSLNGMGFNVSLTQANEAVSNVFGFPNLHSAKKHYATKNESALKNEVKNYIVSFDMKINHEDENIEQKIRKTQIFFDKKIVSFNMYELSKVINFFDFVLDKEMYKQFDYFLKLTSKYISEELKEKYLDLDVSNFITDQDEGFDLDKIFEHKEAIIAFDKVFENNFNNKGFYIYDDFNHHEYYYENFKLKEVNQDQLNFMLDNGVGNY